MKKYFLNVLPLLVAGVMLAACANGNANASFSLSDAVVDDAYFVGQSTGEEYSYGQYSVSGPSAPDAEYSYDGGMLLYFGVDTGDLEPYTGSFTLSIGGSIYELACSEFSRSNNLSGELILTPEGGGESLRFTDLEAVYELMEDGSYGNNTTYMAYIPFEGGRELVYLVITEDLEGIADSIVNYVGIGLVEYPSFRSEFGREYSYTSYTSTVEDVSGIAFETISIYFDNVTNSSDLVQYTGSIVLVIDGSTYEIRCSDFETLDSVTLNSAGGESLSLTNLQSTSSWTTMTGASSTITYSFDFLFEGAQKSIFLELQHDNF